MSMLTNPIQLNIGNSNALVANESVTQIVEVLQPNSELKRLREVLEAIEKGEMGDTQAGPDGKPKILIFMRTKVSCDRK